MNCESLIFDIDGTLWDSRALVAEGYNRQLHKEGLDHLMVTKDDLTPLFGKIIPEIADALFQSIPQPERYALVDRCSAAQDRYLQENPCQVGYPKVKEVLAELAKKYRLFIVSNSGVGYPEMCMEKLGIGEYITDHLCFGDTGTCKGQTILRLMQKHHIKSAAYVGDTQGDYEATVEAGIPFLWAAYGFGKPEHWDAKIEQFSDLLDL